MIQLGLALIMVFTIYALGAPYLQKVLHRSPNDISIVLIPAMVGLVAMAGILGQHLITLSRRWLSVLAFITTGDLPGGDGRLSPGLPGPRHQRLLIPAVVFLALVFGCALGAILIPAFTVLQEGTTEESRGRIFGGVFTVINASIALPLLAFGGAVDLFHSVTGWSMSSVLWWSPSASVFRLIFWSRLAVLDHPAPADATSRGATSSP
jgi:hypothetical protein